MLERSMPGTRLSEHLSVDQSSVRIFWHSVRFEHQTIHLQHETVTIHWCFWSQTWAELKISSRLPALPKGRESQSLLWCQVMKSKLTKVLRSPMICRSKFRSVIRCKRLSYVRYFCKSMQANRTWTTSDWLLLLSRCVSSVFRRLNHIIRRKSDFRLSSRISCQTTRPRTQIQPCICKRPYL